jgi:hypothetical protein
MHRHPGRPTNSWDQRLRDTRSHSADAKAFTGTCRRTGGRSRGTPDRYARPMDRTRPIRAISAPAPYRRDREHGQRVRYSLISRCLVSEKGRVSVV